MAKTIKPELLGGFQDLLPKEAMAKQKMIDTIRRVFESFGFVPLETPGMEKIDVLTGGADFDKSIFVSKIVRGLEDRGDSGVSWDEDYASRFDLTVPLARVVAAYPDLPKPFKRYQIGQVWRGEKPQAGRFREFTQFDFDTIGSNSILSDVEVIQVMYETMVALGIDRFLIKFNTRKILNGLAVAVGCGDKTDEIFRIIDKMDKIGLDGVLDELRRQPDNQFDETAIAMAEDRVAKVKSFLEIKGSTQETLDQLARFFSVHHTIGRSGLEELQDICQILGDLGVSQKNWQVDLSVARGLGYYTGPVFETVLTDMPELGSVFSGGRFDGLTDRFIPNSNIPGVGASVGVSRLLVGMRKLGLLGDQETVTQVLVTIFDKDLRSQSMKLAQEIRRLGVNAEIYYGEDMTPRAQIAYAAKRDIPFVVILGQDEVAQNKVALKDMRQRQQEVLTREECFAKIVSVFSE
ncbi:MAG TPA: histidine--tRNA ligase [Patescibacteria group bacterium]|nr:histidine--tRNA ligase [Patescibacteria group bacterium]